MSNIALQKKQLRLYLNQQRQQLSQADRQCYSTQISQHLLPYLQLKGVQQLLVYKALPFEVSTDDLLYVSGISCFVPRMLEDVCMQWVKVDKSTVWVKAAFGILEPEQGEIWQPNPQQTMMLCPLLGFDRSGHRLGMGKGYFDRWLATFGHAVDEQVGLAFSCQELPNIPIEQHDALLQTIITEKGIIHVQ
ncbi:MAG: 5-formyltetrahydrofolate cyclo-ligase [Ghiorsea sp.]|nr:5-formyltetrahydrofolate cyclo-ligase [Ghiorsea sp.]